MCEELGVSRFEVDTADYDPEPIERKRAERLDLNGRMIEPIWIRKTN